MSFQKLIQYKALSQVYGATGGAMIDQLAKQDPAQIEKMKMRNVCALISVPLFDRLEETCGVLSITKREFIEAALIEALNQADKIIQEEGVFEHFVAITEQSKNGSLAQVEKA